MQGFRDARFAIATVQFEGVLAPRECHTDRFVTASGPVRDRWRWLDGRQRTGFVGLKVLGAAWRDLCCGDVMPRWYDTYSL